MITNPFITPMVGRVTPCAPFDWFAHILGAQRTARPTTPGLWSVFLSRAFVITTASLLLLCPASARAQGGVPLWTNFFGGGSIATDGNGNIFVGGSSPDTGSATIKYSTDGVPLWTNLNVYGPFAVDRSGNLFAFGSSGLMKYSSEGIPLWTNLPRAASQTIALDSKGNAFVTVNTDTGSTTTAYSGEGVPLWTNRFSGHLWASPYEEGGMAVDKSGNVFVTGTLDPGDGYGTIKYSNAGVPVWTNRYHWPTNWDLATAIAVNSTGNVFVTGTSRTGRNSGLTADDYATVAYSNSGVPLWTNRYDGPIPNGEDGAIAIAVDSNGNVFVTGFSNTDLHEIYGLPSYATIKYSNLGVPLWTNLYSGPGYYNEPRAIAVDSSGNVFVTGFSWNDDVSGRTVSYATIAYSNAGDTLWENRYDYGSANAIAVDRNGNVLVTGGSYGGTADWVTIKYSSSVPPSVQLDFQKLNNQLVLSWTNAGFNLQTAPAVTGPFTSLPTATSPYTNVTTSAQQFFRLNGN